MPESWAIPAKSQSDNNNNNNNTNTHHDTIASSFLQSIQDPSPIAQAALARDLEECDSDGESHDDDNTDVDDDDDEGTNSDTDSSGPTLYQQPAGIAFGATRPALDLRPAPQHPHLTKREKHKSRNAERSLLRDNHFLPPKHHHQPYEGFWRELYKKLFSTKIPLKPEDEERRQSISVIGAGENESLLSRHDRDASPYGGINGHGHGQPLVHTETLNEAWEHAVAAGQIKTTWQREAKTIALYSRSLIVTFLLQYSINIASIFAVGHIGKVELGAVSLATMTCNICCYAPFQGLATSLDTLCAQAYGSGHKHLVGLQVQRMICFLMVLYPPIILLFFKADSILSLLIPEPRSVELAGQYLRIILAGVPAMIIFESSKRFVQAQGLFQATTYVLLIAAPINILLNWLLVWKAELGFVGAPIAVVITQNLLPLFLFLYVKFVDGMQCWGGFSRKALSNWGPMVRLALPGMIMLEAEWLAFEVLTLATGRFGTTHLAAQSILITATSTTFQIPFPVSVAGSTRVANLIGAKLVDAAKLSAKVAFIGATLLSFFNAILLYTTRYSLPLLFTQDAEVIELVAATMPICAAMQLFDGSAAVSHGLLRGIGQQEFGGWANIITYYACALPLSFGLAFGLGWKLSGLWTGVTLGLFLISIVEGVYLMRYDWDKAVKEAEARNASS